MTTIPHIIVGLAPLLLAAWLPVRRVARGGSMIGPFFACWGLLVFWFAVFSLGIPLICLGFSRELAHTISEKWVPEPTGLVPFMFLGWLPTAILVLLARGAWRLRNRN